MGSTLRHSRLDESFPAARAGQAVAAKYLKGVAIAAPASCNGVEIGLTPTQGSSQIAKTLTQNFADGSVQGANFTHAQGCGNAQGVEPGLPQGFVNINIAQTGEKGLIQEQRF
jgi:hypothetical protein